MEIKVLLIASMVVLYGCGESKNKESESYSAQDVGEEIQKDPVDTFDQVIPGSLDFTLGGQSFSFEQFDKLKTDLLLSNKGLNIVLTLPEEKRSFAINIADTTVFNNPERSFSLADGTGNGLVFTGFTDADEPLNNINSKSGEIIFRTLNFETLEIGGSFTGEALNSKQESLSFNGEFRIKFDKAEDYRSL